ncbi:type IV secretory pathway VirB2 component (pilin) [Cryobacterium mesophilum]|uniref:DUF4350 domain-containing protein n=1 Tax=Terrimesophilobacter mesophilus TaxID=433647 RepID=A0A4R8V8H1_9MICO|nr:DUF4350 domain-containing protein [Terrimesophilobacter mesophilus]MBB5632628.1 type IV secretory pathway VirB2 component (pilin) [Terrimesophilobacter mesophilus]TFB79441.1 DUF4350 domain-containing protein [Terrimesophilobacter mesophilus]
MTLTMRSDLDTTVVTPTIRKAGRAVRFWIISGGTALIIAVIAIAITGIAGAAGRPLSPTDPHPTGSKAIAQVLRAQGVTVTSVDTVRSARDAAADPASTTIFLVDDDGYLGSSSLRELARLTDNLVVMTPDFDTLDTLAPEIALAGNVSGLLSADCGLRPVQQAGQVTGTGSGFRLIGTDADATQCLSSGNDIHSIIQLARDGKHVTVVGTRDAFTNQFVQDRGNAALALGLLGQTRNLVWMLPSIDEAAAEGYPSIAELTPGWVSTLMALLVIAVIAAGFWRGRRFGPLVVENLPVVVRASETMHGRARLYEKASARLHALDALRMGTIDRLGALCGLPTVASVDDVIRAVSRDTGRQVPDIASLLRDAEPGGERDFIALSDALLDLERATAAATRPSRAAAGGTMDSTTHAHQPPPTATNTKQGE